MISNGMIRSKAPIGTIARCEPLVVVVKGKSLFGNAAETNARTTENLSSPGSSHPMNTRSRSSAEDRERVFMGWLEPGDDKFSVVRAFVSAALPKRLFPFTTTTNGSHRAMVPIGAFERIMPLDIMPTFLLRALVVSDLETAEQLGCLELHEEDLSICSFASPRARE